MEDCIEKFDRSGKVVIVQRICFRGEYLTSLRFPSDLETILESLHSDFNHRPDDVWIHSMPKSGSHWMYEIVGILLRNKLEPLKYFKQTGFIEVTKTMNDLVNLPSPRVLNTHIRIKYLPNVLLDQSKILCVIRNPKSVAVSRYHHGKKTFDGLPGYDGTFSDYLPLWTEGISTLYGSWFDNVLECWEQLKHKSNVLFVF